MSSGQRIRRWIREVHLWLGLLSALPVLLLSVTGALLVFEEELKRLEFADLAYIEGRPGSARQPLDAGVAALRAAYPWLTLSYLTLPTDPDHALVAYARDNRSGEDASAHYVFVDPYTAEVLGGVRADVGILYWARKIHTTFALGEIGYTITLVCTIVFLFIVVSGFFLWYKRGGGWKRFTIKWRVSGRAFHYQLHAAMGFYAFMLLYLIGISGVLIGQGADWRNFILDVTDSEWKRPPALARPVEEGQPGVTLETALRVAEAAMGKPAKWFSFPESRDDPILVEFYIDWVKVPYVDVSVHPVTGDIVHVHHPRDYDLGHLIHRINRGIHSGEYGGIFGDLLWFAASLVPVVLVVTGLRLAIRERRKARAPSRST